MKKKEDIIVEYKDTGELEIYVDRVIKRWNHLWWIAQYRDNFRLVKYKRKDSPMTDYKFSISNQQAHKLINELELSPESGGFGSAISWR